MSQQKSAVKKPNFSSHAKAKSVKGKTKKPDTILRVTSKRAPPGESLIIQGDSGYCTQRCGRCVSCLVAKGNEDVRKNSNAFSYRYVYSSGRDYQIVYDYVLKKSRNSSTFFFNLKADEQPDFDT